MHLYYRISDKSYDKPKLIGATKEICFMNFIKAFHEVIFKDAEMDGFVPPVRIIADRCERKTVKMLQESGMPITITDYGNAGSLIKAIEMAIDTHSDDELVYFCEDDYLHLGSSPKLLEEGIEQADYVSLYDHPDKYTRAYNMGEYSKVIKTKSSHWRFTVSTCMTFGTKIGILKEDIEIWKKFTSETHPHDHHIFTELGKNGRKLIIPIPGVTCHTDLWLSGKAGEILIDQWAIDMMIRQLELQLDEYEGPYYTQSRALGMRGKANGDWNHLVMLDALLKNFEQH